MSSIIDNFLSSLSAHSGCVKGVEESFKSLNNEIKNKKVTIGKRDVKNIISTMYLETRNYPELNQFWGRYTNILQYNNKEVRRFIVKELVGKDVDRNVTCPYRVLDLLFQDREMVKICENKKTFFQAVLQVRDLCPDYLNYLGGDSKSGETFRKNLGNFIIDTWRPLFLLKPSEEIPKYIGEVLRYVGLNRSKLNQIDDCDIVSNFQNFKKVWCNLDFDAFDSKCKEQYYDHTRTVQKHNSFNYGKLIDDYKKGNVKKDIFLENLYVMMMYEEKREEILKCLTSKLEEFYEIFKNLDIDFNSDIGVIPEEITKLYTIDEYPSKIIKPTFGDSYFSYQKSSLFRECNPMECNQSCDKSSHHDWFKLTLVEDSNRAIEVIDKLKGRVVEGSTTVLFMDIKLSIKDSTEEITYINIFFPRSEFISFNLGKINNSFAANKIVDFLFSTKEYQICCYNNIEMKKKFAELFREVFRDRIGQFPYATVIGLLNRLSTLVESGGEECSIPKYFPNTWKQAYRYKSIDYTKYSDDEEEVVEDVDDEISITKQQRRCIRKMSPHMEFRNLCYLTTGYDYDESESTPYSFWHRNPLRTQQHEEMKTHLIALYDILYYLNNAMYKDPDYKNIGVPILTVRIGKK
uniref:RING-type domain-containing protein n=1 Tax=Strongyloides venezuelensis TaxID=75913 RepID=A0A0K0F6C8_STRVS